MMIIQSIDSNQIQSIHSPFYIAWAYSNLPQIQPYLIESIQSIGIQIPLLVQKKEDGSIYLIDGFSRFQAATALSLTKIPCIVLPPEYPILEMGKLVFLNHRTVIQSSTIAAIRFLSILEQLGISDVDLVQVFLPLLGFQSHPEFLKKCRLIQNMNPVHLDFFHEKQFSFKQCMMLASYDPQLITQLLAWKAELHLTASIILELAEWITDYIKWHDLPLQSVFTDPELQKQIDSPYSSQEKTKLVRTYFREKRFPELSHINQDLQSIKNTLNLPNHIDLNWDTSLDQSDITIQLKIRQKTDFEKSITFLEKPSTKEAILTFLDRL